MARIAVLAHRLKLRRRVIRPDVCRLHTHVAILAVGNRIARQTVHEIHLSHPTTGIFNEPERRRQCQNQAQNVLIYAVAEFRILTDRGKIPVFLLHPMVADSRNGIRRTVGAGPDDIGSSESFENIVYSHTQDVCIEVDISERFIPLNAKYFVSVGFECFSDTSRACKQL